MNANGSHHGVPVSIQGISKSFGVRQALKDISLEVGAGELFAIMGPSGSGKSLLLRHILGLETPDTGEIQIAGCKVQTKCISSEYGLSVVFQSGALLNSLTVAENVGLYFREHRLKPKAEIHDLARNALQTVGLDPDYISNRMPGDLSGGEKKRVAIARAIVTEPDLLLYDEPTSELDPASSTLVAQAIVDLNERLNVTSIVVTHDRELAVGIADRIAILEAGSLLKVGAGKDFGNIEEHDLRRLLYADYSFRNPS